MRHVALRQRQRASDLLGSSPHDQATSPAIRVARAIDANPQLCWNLFTFYAFSDNIHITFFKITFPGFRQPKNVYKFVSNGV